MGRRDVPEKSGGNGRQGVLQQCSAPEGASASRSAWHGSWPRSTGGGARLRPRPCRGGPSLRPAPPCARTPAPWPGGPSGAAGRAWRRRNSRHHSAGHSMNLSTGFPGRRSRGHTPPPVAVPWKFLRNLLGSNADVPRSVLVLMTEPVGVDLHRRGKSLAADPNAIRFGAQEESPAVPDAQQQVGGSSPSRKRQRGLGPFFLLYLFLKCASLSSRR